VKYGFEILQWAEKTSRLREIAAVFSVKKYGEELAKTMAMRHQLVLMDDNKEIFATRKFNEVY
jgi:hypothetical protein